MTIKISHSWLKDYLETSVTPEEIAKFLTLCGPTVESTEKVGEDIVYTIEVTPNRNDLMSIIGLAKETYAILRRFEKKAELVNPQGPDGHIEKPTGEILSLEIIHEPKSIISGMQALIVKDLKIGPSPEFIKERLEKSGIRSLNNVIDISNYVMLVTGQPLHIFDYDNIQGQSMSVRESKPGEKLTTLDGIERLLPSGSVVIEDKSRLIDLCGIMGAENSGISDTTTRGLIWIELYDPLRIRKTFRSLNLATEAALRYEKYLDPTMVPVAMRLTLALLKEYAGAHVASELHTQGNFAPLDKEVEVDLTLIQEYLEERIEINRAAEYLEYLGFGVEIVEASFTSPKLRAKVPSWRVEDIKIPEDLIEEIARLHGYNNLKNTLPTGSPPANIIDHAFDIENRVKDTLKHLGFSECYNYSFTSEDSITNLGLNTDQALSVTNPINQDLAYLRPSLLCSLLPNLYRNRHFSPSSLRPRWTSGEAISSVPLKLFELERVVEKSKGGALPEETFHLSAVSYQSDSTPQQFSSLKYVLEQVLQEINISDFKVAPATNLEPFWDKERSADIIVNGLLAGNMGYLDQKVVSDFGLSGNVTAIDLLMKPVLDAARLTKTLPLPITHPPVIEDLSVVAPARTHMSLVQKVITDAIMAEDSLSQTRITLTDVYHMKEEGKTSFTFRLTYQSSDGTPSRDQVTSARERILNAVKDNSYTIR